MSEIVQYLGMNIASAHATRSPWTTCSPSIARVRLAQSATIDPCRGSRNPLRLRKLCETLH